MSDFLVIQARAAREFGVPWEAFDSLTPSDLAKIAEDHRKTWVQEQKLADMRAARIAAAVYRSYGQKVKESQFLNDYEEPKEKPKAQSFAEMRAKLVMWAMATNS